MLSPNLIKDQKKRSSPHFGSIFGRNSGFIGSGSHFFVYSSWRLLLIESSEVWLRGRWNLCRGTLNLDGETLNLDGGTRLPCSLSTAYNPGISNFGDIRKRCLCKSFCGISNTMFDYPESHSWFQKEVLRNHSFWLSQNFEMLGCQWFGVKRIKSIFFE